MADAPQPFAYVVLVLLTALSGCFSGLNLGLMSLTVEDLNIVVRSSTDPLQVEHAKKILPLRKRGNMLLCTLLIGNTVVNVMLAVVTDPIWVYICGSGIAGQIFALALPSALIVVFGEIVPQSVCSRYALSIGARTLPLTYVFVVITFPFAYPISIALDRILGDEISGVFTRQGLIELIKLNVESAAHAKGSGLTKADGRLLGGALTFKDRTVGEVMTPLSQVYSLPLTAVLDEPTFLAILQRGHTRIPIYDGEPTNIVALLLAKNLLGIGYERRMPLHAVLAVLDTSGGARATHVVKVHTKTKLNVALDVCKRKRVHMLLVTDEALSPSEGGSLISLRSERSGEHAAAGGSHRVSNEGSHPLAEQTTISEVGESSVERKEYVGVGRAVGIATVEDFLEEILQEEIVDETDVYVDNSHPSMSTLSHPLGSISSCAPSEVLSEITISEAAEASVAEGVAATSATSGEVREASHSCRSPSASTARSPSKKGSNIRRSASGMRVNPLKRLNSKHFDTTVVLRHAIATQSQSTTEQQLS